MGFFSKLANWFRGKGWKEDLSTDEEIEKVVKSKEAEQLEEAEKVKESKDLDNMGSEKVEIDSEKGTGVEVIDKESKIKEPRDRDWETR